MNKEKKTAGPEKEESEKKVSLGETLLNNAKAAKDAALRGAASIRDVKLEFTGKDNHVDFEEGLKTANTDIDPQKYDLATDGKDEARVPPKFGERDLFKNIERAERALADDAKSGEYRKRQIDQQEQKINRIMDEKNSDILENTIRGYHVELLRVPQKETNLKDMEIIIGGKKASIHEDLEGMSFSTNGSRPEISRDMIKKAAEDMAAYGKTEWNKGYDNGDGVDISMEASYGKTPVTVTVSDEMKGGGVRIMQAGKYMGGKVWDNAYESMKKTGTSAWKGVLEDGTTVDCSFTVKVNGKDACIEGMTDKDQNGPSISKEKWEEAYKAKTDNKKQTWATTLDDGTTISCSLNTFVDGEKAKIDRTEDGMWAKDMPARAFISKETWDSGIDRITSDPAGANRAVVASENGKGLELRMNMKVNGMTAVPNTPFRNGEIRETKAGISVSKDVVENAIQEMDKNSSTMYKTTAGDGREISFKRPGKLHMFVDGHEINEKDLRSAIAEVSGLNSNVDREKSGSNMRETDEQRRIIVSRKIGEMPFTAAQTTTRTMSREFDRGRATTGSLLRMLLQQASKAIGR